MSLIPPTIRAVVAHQGGRATDVAVRVQGLPDVALLLEGRPAADALARVVAVHGVCARAHAAAGTEALRVAGVALSEVPRQEVVEEALREALLTLVREPARLLGGEVDSTRLVGVLRGDDREGALVAIIGADPTALADDPAALEAWLQAGETPLARLVAGTAALVTGQAGGELVGPVARHAERTTVRAALAEGRAGLARWIARLVEVGDMVGGDAGTVGLVEAEGVPRWGSAKVESARGALVHEVQLDEDGNVVGWQLDRPTFRALTEAALRPAIVGRPLADAVQAAELLMASLDPCFSWSVEVEEG